MSAAALESLLEEERRLILGAEWEALAALGAPKAEGLAALGGAAPGPLLDSLRRNQALLAAAIEGLGEAARRRAALASARAGLRTYDATGAAARVAAPRPRVERRA